MLQLFLWYGIIQYPFWVLWWEMLFYQALLTVIYSCKSTLWNDLKNIGSIFSYDSRLAILMSIKTHLVWGADVNMELPAFYSKLIFEFLTAVIWVIAI